MKQLSLICLFVVSSIFSSFAQDLKLPALSPVSMVKTGFSISDIEVKYSRPSMRGRKIFGDLVPYGELWRVGANAATKVTFGENVIINDQAIPKGSYALYAIPNNSEWEIIFNRGIDNWGTGGYSKDEDVYRFKTGAIKNPNTVETFTINIADITNNTCNIELAWENTRVLIPIKVDNNKYIVNNIKKAVEEPNIPYYPAARYYYTTDQNLEDALTYVTKALDQNPKAFYMWNLKAQIAQKLGKKDVAISAANKAIETSKGTAYENEYKKSAGDIINTMK